MRPPALSLAVCCLTSLTAAQCEIARPGSDLQSFYFHQTSFAGDVITLSGSGNQVQIYQPGPNGWINTTSLTTPGFWLFENPTVRTDGQRILVGMIEDGPGSSVEGRVYVYEQQGGSWGPPTMLKAQNPSGFDTFGSGMAIDGDRMVIGASMTVQDVICGPGKSLFFEHDGTDWVQVAKFDPHGQIGSMGGYGFNVDLEGDTAVLGAHFDDEADKMAGAVYVYQRDPVLGWSEEVKLFADTPTMNEFFGNAVALDGDTLYVGAPGLDTGAIYVLERQPSGWQTVDVLTPSSGRIGDAFGSSIALGDGYLVAGAPGTDVPGKSGVGGFVAFQRQAGAWVEIGGAVASDAGTSARYGLQVSLVGNQVLWSGAYPYAGDTRLHSLGIDRQTNYCQTTPNSSGNAAVIAGTGCDSIFANQLSLAVFGAPPVTPAALLMGTSPTNVPFGNGSLCVSTFGKVAVGPTDALGHWTPMVDFQTGPPSQFSAGQAAFFQAYFRDQGFGAGFGTSNGVVVELNL